MIYFNNGAQIVNQSMLYFLFDDCMNEQSYKAFFLK